MRSKKPNPYSTCYSPTYNFNCKETLLNCENAIPPTLYFRKHGHRRAINIDRK